MAEPPTPTVPGRPDGEISTRSPCDVLRLVVASVVLLVLLLVERLVGSMLTSFTARFLQGLSAVPTWLLDLLTATTRVVAVAFLVVGLALGLVRRRWRMLLVVTAAIAIALIGFAVLHRLEPASRPSAVALAGLVPPGFPTADGLAAAAAFATAVAPWASRRWRRVAWLLVVGMTISRLLVSPIAFDSVNALAIGWFAGAAALVLLGAPTRRPGVAAIVDALDAVGLPDVELERAGVDARGSTPYFGHTQDGRALFVKVLGADERSADLLFRAYRAVLPHDLGDERPFSSLRRTVEHEALVALLAREVGVRTPPFVALARAEPNAFVLAYEAIAGRSLDSVDESDLTDGLLDAIWEQVSLLHRRGIAHRDLRLANVFRDDTGAVWLIDFGFSEAAASSLLLDTDRTELVASTATRTGARRAVAVASGHLDAAELDRVRDRLRTWALSGATRTALKADPRLMDDLRAELSSVASARPDHSSNLT
jgi:undecaprenyl-diphosphatase